VPLGLKPNRASGLQTRRARSWRRPRIETRYRFAGHGPRYTSGHGVCLGRIAGRTEPSWRPANPPLPRAPTTKQVGPLCGFHQPPATRGDGATWSAGAEAPLGATEPARPGCPPPPAEHRPPGPSTLTARPADAADFGALVRVAPGVDEPRRRHAGCAPRPRAQLSA